MDSGLPSQPIDGLEAFDGYDNESTDGGALDADFGALEMFDSNAVTAPFSTQSQQLYSDGAGQAPDAVMSADAPSSPSKKKKSKRDKKGKKKDDYADAPPEEGRHKRAKDASALETSEAADALTTLASAAEPYVQRSDQVEDAGSSSPVNQKRKRKPSDASSAKKRSKKRRGGGDSVDLGTGEASATTAGFLHNKDDGADLTAIADADADADGADPQASPTVEHLRHQQHAEQVYDAPDGLMADASIPGLADGQIQGSDAMGELAREAWQEHLQNQGNAHEEDATLPDAEEDITEHNYATPPEHSIHPEPEPEPEQPSADLSPSNTRPKRSRAKKAKPTFYENPPDEPEDDGEASVDLSSSAESPKRRVKSKAAARKKAPRRRKSSPGDEDEEGSDGERKGNKRSKTDGFIQGRFTDAELQVISKAVEAFRAENNLSQRDVNEMIHAAGGTSAGDAHAQLWTRLFAECPDRHRQKVINITRKKFHNFVARGTWTAEQEAELRSLIIEHGQKWSKIASLINRHPEDIRDRFRNYIVCGDAQKKDAWTQEEESRLAQFVIEAMQAIDTLRAQYPRRQIYQKGYDELIDWQNISERMDRTRSRLQCITKWKSMHLKFHGNDQLVSLQPDSQISFNLERARRQIGGMPEEERYRLVMAIKDTAVGTDSKIPWQKLVDKRFRNEYHRTTQVLLWHRYSKQVPQYQEKSTRDRAQHLIDQYNQVRELPDVDGDDWDDAEEMQCIANAFSSSQRAPKKKKGEAGENQVSADSVPVDAEPAGSDDEGADGAANETGNDVSMDGATGEAEAEADGVTGEAAGQDYGLQIDPALTHDPAMAMLAAENAGRPAITPSKPPRITYGRNRGSARKDLSQDPIEDDEGQGPTTPGKQRSKAGGKHKTPKGKNAPLPPVEASPGLSSNMDDMEDLPAQLPA